MSKLDENYASRKELKKSISEILLEMEFHILELTKQQKGASKLEFVSGSQLQ